MGLLEKLGLRPATLEPPPADYLAAPIYGALADNVNNMSVEQLWREQPYLRTVTDFIARNIASVSLHAYKREADGGRTRLREGDLPRLLKRANSSQLMFDVIYSAVLDLCLYDECFLAVQDGPGTPEVLPIPPTWIQAKKWRDRWTLKSVIVADDNGQRVELPAERLIHLHGYAPGTFKRGTSPVDALKATLREQLNAARYRGQLWDKGPRISGVIERPQGANWDQVARQRFKQSWATVYASTGSGAGGTPVLEDGMTFKPMHLKANDEQFVDVAKLSLATVASVYHVNPTMVGLLDNANYSNVREFRKMLYGDSLGPLIKKLEDAFNVFLLPMIGAPSGVYVEFNLDEKLRASFEEKAAVTSAAVGAPWMTPNEARAMNNLTAIDGGDRLLRPLNMDNSGDERDTLPEVEGPK
ncbi:phage portal protein [Corynebacterium aquilae]|uniref:phage portal protein n=1 Tax=Corynebacterium aquilae TaxID=203263 RepID=UPI000950DB27|nr:phage portal protein [Corynebacterium aquilae]